MARAIARARGSSPYSRRIRAISASSASLRKSAAVGPDLLHAHVERTVGREGKAAVRSVQLHRRDADIERDGVDEADAAFAKHAVHLAEPLFDERQIGVRDERSAGFDRIGVTIESNHSSRPHPKQRARVAACSKSAVDRRFTRLDRHSGQHFVEKHRHVRRL